jgi:hypothetical protein
MSVDFVLMSEHIYTDVLIKQNVKYEVIVQVSMGPLRFTEKNK